MIRHNRKAWSPNTKGRLLSEEPALLMSNQGLLALVANDEIVERSGGVLPTLGYQGHAYATVPGRQVSAVEAEAFGRQGLPSGAIGAVGEAVALAGPHLQAKRKGIAGLNKGLRKAL